jgi:hypothetical protein
MFACKKGMRLPNKELKRINSAQLFDPVEEVKEK